MNCQDIGKILNDDDIGALSPDVVNSARTHLATCNECARDWELHKRMLAMPMPAPGPELLGWRPVNRGVDTAPPSRRSLRGTLFIGALIAVGAAAAVYVAVEQAESMRTTASPAVGPVPAPAPGLEPGPASDVESPQSEPVGTAAGSFANDEQPGSIATDVDSSRPTNQPDVAPNPEPIVESTMAAAPSETIAARCSRTTNSSGPLKVVLLPARAWTPDPAAEALVGEIRQDTLRALLAMPTVEVVDLSPVDLASVAPPNAGSLSDDNLLYVAVSQRYQSTLLAEISERTVAGSLSWSINLLVRNAGGASGRSNEVSKDGSPAISPLAQSLGVQPLGVQYAAAIMQRAARPSMPTMVPDACNVFFDASRPESERLRALAQLRNDGIDSETLAAAVALAVESPSANTRQRAWFLLRQGEYHPPLAGYMSSALLSDADAAVRKEAALGLAAYLGEGSTLAALEHAAGNDASSEVRLAARMAMMSHAEQLAFKREVLLDRSLTAAERFAPTSNFKTLRIPIPDPLTSNDGQTEDALAYSEILGATDDPDLENSVLSELVTTLATLRIAKRSDQLDTQIIRVLTETVASNDRRVRRQAITALVILVEFPEARAALESVIENYPELAADIRIDQILAPQQMRTSRP